MKQEFVLGVIVRGHDVPKAGGSENLASAVHLILPVSECLYSLSAASFLSEKCQSQESVLLMWRDVCFIFLLTPETPAVS